jgi:hypothetical protein
MALFLVLLALVAVVVVGVTALLLRGFVRVFGAGVFCLLVAIYLLW